MDHIEALMKASLQERQLKVLIALIGTCKQIPDQHLLNELVEKAKDTVSKLNS